ncbi:Serine/threonine-protein kinase-like protein At3g51990 [Linum perenne]
MPGRSNRREDKLFVTASLLHHIRDESQLRSNRSITATSRQQPTASPTKSCSEEATMDESTRPSFAAVASSPSRFKKSSKRLESGQQDFDNELEILSNIQSTGLVNLLGFANSELKDRLLVVEFMRNDTLYDVLHSDFLPVGF